MRLPCKRPTRRRHTDSLFSPKILCFGFFLTVRVISLLWDIHGNENEKVSIRKRGYGISRAKGGKHAAGIAGNKLQREQAWTLLPQNTTIDILRDVASLTVCITTTKTQLKHYSNHYLQNVNTCSVQPVSPEVLLYFRQQYSQRELFELFSAVFLSWASVIERTLFFVTLLRIPVIITFSTMLSIIVDSAKRSLKNRLIPKSGMKALLKRFYLDGYTH